jgi:hypothetical protein
VRAGSRQTTTTIQKLKMVYENLKRRAVPRDDMQALPLRRECGTREGARAGRNGQGSGGGNWARELGMVVVKGQAAVASLVWAKCKVRNNTCDHDYARARQGLVGQVQGDLEAWSSLARLSKALRTPCETLARRVQAFTAPAGVTRP